MTPKVFTADFTNATNYNGVYGIHDQYSSRYAVDLFTHPAFAEYDEEAKAFYFQHHPRKEQGLIVIGGCKEWTPEQFIANIKSKINLEICLRDGKDELRKFFGGN